MSRNPKFSKLTSVKVDPEVFDKFQINGVKLRHNFTQLVNTAIYLFNEDEEFRRKVMNTKLPK